MIKIFIVVPVFNEEQHISGVLKGIRGYNLPVVVVDDGSTDGSKDGIQNLKIRNLTLLEHKVNLGKGSAMKTGADYAFSHGAEAVIFMDSDAQHAPGDLSKFMNILEKKKCDVLFGSRNLNLGIPLARYFGNKAASLFVRFLFGIYVSDLICGFRAVTRRGYEKIRWESTGYGVETEMVVRTAKEKVKHCEVSVETIYHNKVKGVTLLDAFGIFFSVLKWRLSI